MREQLFKRTKSRSASLPATPKRSSKQTSSKSAKTSSRQKTDAKATPKKTLLKPLAIKKKRVTPKITAKADVAPKVATKKKPAVVQSKKAAPMSLPIRTITKKLTNKAQVESVKQGNPTIKSSVKTSLVPKRVAKVKPKASVISRHQLATQALRAFEQAVKVFNLREFSEAKTMFEELQQRYHQEVEIIARSQTYIQVCNVRLANNRALPRNADEFYDRGVVALNVGNFVQARTLFEKALKLRPDDSYTLYSLAATLAQVGSTDQALTYLEQAVRKQPRLRQQALHDTDFSTLKENRRFLELLGATSPFDLLEARREIP